MVSFVSFYFPSNEFTYLLGGAASKGIHPFFPELCEQFKHITIYVFPLVEVWSCVKFDLPKYFLSFEIKVKHRRIMPLFLVVPLNQ